MVASSLTVVTARGPCPGINALANHGFIPRDGRGISPRQLASAAFEGLGTTPDIIAGGLALSFLPDILNVQTFRFDLENLGTHDFLKEHDCSLSREDAALGDNSAFNISLWNMALAEMKHDLVTPFDVGRARAARVRDQTARNPHTDYGTHALVTSALESGMIVALLGAGSLPRKDWLRSFFEHERLPTHLGWAPKPFANNGLSALSFGLTSVLAAPELLPRIGVATA